MNAASPQFELFAGTPPALVDPDETIQGAFERFHATNGADFKLNNNLRSRYARLIQRERTDLAPMFETRRLKAA